MTTYTKEAQQALSPKEIKEILQIGNQRFTDNLKMNRNLKLQVKETSEGQNPIAVVLGCIDSRVPAETIFDQGIGDIFNARVAGNIVNEDILGSIEYGCKVAGSKLVLVLGHTKCGAVTSACKHVELGNITALLNKIQPAVKAVIPDGSELTQDLIESVAEKNVFLTIDRIRKESPILNEMEQNGEIIIVGGIYAVETGKVTFL